jgi:hypothetical protein
MTEFKVSTLLRRSRWSVKKLGKVNCRWRVEESAKESVEEAIDEAMEEAVKQVEGGG